MKKYVIKIICFAAIFLILFTLAGSVLEKDWTKGEYLPERYIAYAEEESVDVLYMGASNIYADIAPVVIWHEAGLTGFNLGVSSSCMMLAYYQLEYALKEHKPSLVVLDVTGLSNGIDPSGEDEAAFQKIVSTMPDRSVKMELLCDMNTRYEDVNLTYFLFPLLRYHERWEELTEPDFNRKEAADTYKAFGKGSYIRSDLTDIKASDFEWITERNTIPDENTEFLEKIYGLCKDSGTELLLTFCPNMKGHYIDYQAGKRFAGNNGIGFIGFETVDDILAIGITPENSYYNVKHLNIRGQKVYSQYIADYISRHYSIAGHTGDDELSKKWDAAYEEYMAYYNESMDG